MATSTVSCLRASKAIARILQRVDPERRVDLILWASHQFDEHGKTMGGTPSDATLPEHMDCQYYEECHGTELFCKRKR